MRKKQKRTYSLTAKERKAKRYAEENRVNANARGQGPEREAETVTLTREGAEKAMLASQKRSRFSAWFVGGVICLAVLLMIAALIVPVGLYVVNPYRGYNSVIARINLSNGQMLEFIIEEDEYDTAATNFIFLAKNGFFDNTVFFDAQNGWLRFGGYEEQPATAYTSQDYARSHHRKDSTSYCNAFTALPNSSFEKSTYKFGYRLNKDKNGDLPRVLEREGILAFMYGSYSTEFQFSYTDQPVNTVTTVGGSGPGTAEISATRVGRALNRSTINIIKQIASTAKINQSIVSGNQWMPPTPDIKIKNIKIYNLDDSKWKNFNFIKYMGGKDKDNNNRLSQWQGQA